MFDKQRANHVLVNEYLPGQGIMPHSDGPLFHPIISTISCGSHTVLEFTAAPANSDDDAADADAGRAAAAAADVRPTLRRKPSTAGFQLMVERRSLLILQDDMYHRYLHGIAERDVDRIADDMLNLQQCCDERSFGERVTREKRVSLTIRHVPKTSRLKLQLGGVRK